LRIHDHDGSLIATRLARDASQGTLEERRCLLLKPEIDAEPEVATADRGSGGRHGDRAAGGIDENRLAPVRTEQHRVVLLFQAGPPDHFVGRERAR